MHDFFKSLWIAIVSWSCLLGMLLSIISLNLVHAVIIGFKIFAIWLFNMAIVIYLIIRDERRGYKKKRGNKK